MLLTKFEYSDNLTVMMFPGPTYRLHADTMVQGRKLLHPIPQHRKGF